MISSSNILLKRGTIKAMKSFFSQYPFVDFVVLFGSVAKQKTNRFSDIDVGIFTDRELRLLEVGYLAAQLEKKLKVRVDLIVLNDLFKKKPNFTFQIIKDGIPIFFGDESKWIEYKRKVYLYFLDTQHLRREMDFNFRKRLESGNFANARKAQTA